MVIIRHLEITDPLNKTFNQDPFDPQDPNSLWDHPALQNLELLNEKPKVAPGFAMKVVPNTPPIDGVPDVSSETARQESLHSSPSLTASTPPLTREPSVASSSVKLCSPSSSSFDEQMTDSTPASSITTTSNKAAARAAKRRARREINKEKRRAEEAAKTKKAPGQGWEIALDGLPPLKAKRQLRAQPESIAAFQVPLDAQVATKSGSPIPATDFSLEHNVASAIVEELIAAYGGWSVTFSDPSYRIWISAGKDAAISYKHVKGMFHHYAIVFGDPVCSPKNRMAIIEQFQAYCEARYWRLAMVGVGEYTAACAAAARWTTIQFAHEQIVDPQHNAILDGTHGKRMLCTVRKLAKEGVLRMYHPSEGKDDVLEAFLQGVYDECYASKEAAAGEATAYSTKLSLFALPHLQTYFYTVDAEGHPNGMAALMAVGEGRYLLDPVVAIPSAPPGTTDFLTVAAMGFLRRAGVRHMTFGLEPQRLIGTIDGLKQVWHKPTRRVNAAAFDGFGFAGKKMLHDKFYPDPSRSESLYIVLASSYSIAQADGAMAICAATHIKAGPVLKRLVPWSKNPSKLDKPPQVSEQADEGKHSDANETETP